MVGLRSVFRSRCGRFGDGRLKVRQARSGIPASVFGKLVKALLSPASCPPNKSFKPTPCLSFVETSGHAGNTGSHPSRSARLNSGVRRQRACGSWLFCTASPSASVGMLFGQFASTLSLRLLRRARSSVACVALAGFGNRDRHRIVLPRLIHGFGHSQLQVRRRAQASGLRFSVRSSVIQRRGVPARLTSRSSRPRVVASAMCFTLRSHMSAAPPQGGLTPALGGKEHSTVALSALQHVVFGRHCSSDGS